MEQKHGPEALQLTTAEVRKFRMMAREGKPMTEIAAALDKPYMRLSRWARKHGYRVKSQQTFVDWEIPADV
jgi:hypothetical protein